MHGRTRREGIKRHSGDTASASISAPLRLIIHGTLLLLFALIAAASFLPDRRLWGINHLAFFPVHVRVIALLVMAVSFLPAAARSVHSFLSGMIDRIRPRRTFFNWAAVIIAIISAAVFVRFRSSTLLLGDGQLIVRNYEYVSEGYSNVVMRDIRTILRDEDIARGASILYFLSVRVSETIFGGSPIDGIRIFNCILGGIFAFLFLSIVLRMELSTELRIWIIFLMLSSGTMQLFFGYAENYTPLMFVCFLYLTSGFAVLHG